MTAHIMQHSEHQAWPMMAGWVAGSTWSKRVASVDSDSWEVRAFAEDASGSGQWPPRSYSCSFCQREFRTAQALGGHMNVHRRERAHANQLASLRSRLSSDSPATTTTVDLLSPKAQTQSSMSLSGSALAHNSSATTTPHLSSSPPSQESISSSSPPSELGTKPLLQSIPDILSQSLSQQNGTSTLSWAPPRAGSLSYHPYEKSSLRCKPGSHAGARFSFCLNKVMGEHEDTLDLELRLGRSSCAV